MLALLITEDSECVVLSGDGLAHDLQAPVHAVSIHGKAKLLWSSRLHISSQVNEYASRAAGEVIRGDAYLMSELSVQDLAALLTMSKRLLPIHLALRHGPSWPLQPWGTRARTKQHHPHAHHAHHHHHHLRLHSSHHHHHHHHQDGHRRGSVEGAAPLRQHPSGRGHGETVAGLAPAIRAAGLLLPCTRHHLLVRGGVWQGRRRPGGSCGGGNSGGGAPPPTTEPQSTSTPPSRRHAVSDAGCRHLSISTSAAACTPPGDLPPSPKHRALAAAAQRADGAVAPAAPWADLPAAVLAAVALLLPRHASQLLPATQVCTSWRQVLLADDRVAQHAFFSLDLHRPLAGAAAGSSPLEPGLLLTRRMLPPPRRCLSRDGQHPAAAAAAPPAAASNYLNAYTSALFSAYAPAAEADDGGDGPDDAASASEGSERGSSGGGGGGAGGRRQGAAAALGVSSEVVRQLRAALAGGVPALVRQALRCGGASGGGGRDGGASGGGGGGGNASALACMAQLLEVVGREDEALRLWRKSAKLGDAEAALRLGMASYQGAPGCPLDLEAAQQWLGRGLRQLLGVSHLSASLTVDLAAGSLTLRAHEAEGPAAASLGGTGAASPATEPSSSTTSTSSAAGGTVSLRLEELWQLRQRQQAAAAAQASSTPSPRGPSSSSSPSASSSSSSPAPMAASAVDYGDPQLEPMLASAAVMLAFMYLDGEGGLRVDTVTAIKLFRLAVLCGSREAARVLCWVFSTGQYGA